METTEDKKERFEVGHTPDSDAESDTDERTVIDLRVEPIPPSQVARRLDAASQVGDEKTYRARQIAMGLVLLGVFASFVGECAILNNRNSGWIDVIAMSQDKNYDSVVATYGWYDVHVITNDLLLRGPDWSDWIGAVGALSIIIYVFICAVLIHSICKGPNRFFNTCRPLLSVAGASGLVAWVLYAVNVTSYINTRDFYWHLRSSCLLFMINHASSLLLSSSMLLNPTWAPLS